MNNGYITHKWRNTSRVDYEAVEIGFIPLNHPDQVIRIKLHISDAVQLKETLKHYIDLSQCSKSGC